MWIFVFFLLFSFKTQSFYLMEMLSLPPSSPSLPPYNQLQLHRDTYGLEMAVDFIKGKWELRVLSIIKKINKKNFCAIWMSCNQQFTTCHTPTHCIVVWRQKAFNSIISIMLDTSANMIEYFVVFGGKLRHLLMNDFILRNEAKKRKRKTRVLHVRMNAYQFSCFYSDNLIHIERLCVLFIFTIYFLNNSNHNWITKIPFHFMGMLFVCLLKNHKFHLTFIRTRKKIWNRSGRRAKKNVGAHILCVSLKFH